MRKVITVLCVLVYSTGIASEYTDETLKEVLSNVRLRAMPSTDSNALAIIPGGFVISVSGKAEQTSQWFRVKGVLGEYPDGYIHSDLLADPTTSFNERQIKSSKFLIKSFEPRHDDWIYPQSHARLYTADGEFVSHLPRLQDIRALNGVYNQPLELDTDFPYFEIRAYSGGAHCCFESRFVSKDPPLERTINLPYRVTETRFSDERNSWEVEVDDPTYEYWQYSYAYSPIPSVTLALTSKGTIVSREAMAQNPPSGDELLSMISETPKDDGKISYVTANMLTLIYGGNLESAEKYLENAWPDDYRHETYDREQWDRNKYKTKLYEKIKSSPFFRSWMLD